MSDVEGLARVVSGALTDAEEWVKSAEVENIVEAILISPWLAARVQAARAEAWDEGRNVGALDEHRWDPTPNPYRAAALRADDAGGEGL